MATGEFKRMINGVEVVFPCKPYPSQFSMMDKVIKGIERRQNCLLESPTGSGKSLALLCSALAWQVAEYDKKEKEEACKEEQDSGCCNCKKLTDKKLDKDNSTNQSNNTTNISDPEPYNPSWKSKQLTICEEKVEQNNCLTIPDSDDEDGDFKDSGTKFRTPGNQGQVALKNLKRLQQETTSPDQISDSPAKLNSSQGSLNDSMPDKCNCSCKDDDSGTSKRKIPKIYFGTRTHKQITQIVRELNKTAYRETRMTILASREHTCIHPAVSKMSSKPEGCKELLDGPGCRFNERVKRYFQNQDQIKSLGLKQAWDIEDLVDLCKSKKACAYFGSRALRKDADIVFCPYNYLVDPVIRDAMEINLKDQIIILDEAHNIEDSSREAASESLKQDQLDKAIKELDEMAVHNIKTPQHLRLRQMCSGLQKIILDNSDNLNHADYDQSYSVWSGYDIIVRLKQEGIGPEHFDDLKRCYSEIIEAESDEEKKIVRDRFGKEVKLSSAVLMVLRQIFKVLDYLYREDLKFVPDYRVAVVKSTIYRADSNTNDKWLGSRNKRGGKIIVLQGRSTVPVTESSLNFWCMNPGVAFSDFNSSRNVILTSGTLSPMGSFQSELGVPFPIQLEANHVIQDKQVWVGAIGRGPSGGSLQAVYKTMESFNFQDELGMLVYNVCEKVPHGVLLFLPSYRALDKFRERWKNTGLWDKIFQKKKIVAEPRASEKMDFEQLMKYFYDVIEGDTGDDEDCSDVNGALFIAVCRGKVSEGLDFADNNARAVITVGIPYPNFKDVQVKLKREYNDRHKLARGLLSGAEWYEIQAFRALNQALGRCIRHRKDWGALILVDERFVRNDHQKYIKGLSKWVRNKVQHFTNFGHSMESLSTFTKERQIDMPTVDLETSFIPCTPVTPGMATRRLEESPVSSIPQYTENSTIKSPEFSTPYKINTTAALGGSFLESPQPSVTPSNKPQPCSFMSPTEVRKNPVLSQATTTQQVVQAQPGIQNNLLLLSSTGQSQVTNQAGASLNLDYSQILQIMNSPHVPKDKPYYIIINEGTPAQQMLLIQPPRQTVNPQMTTAMTKQHSDIKSIIQPAVSTSTPLKQGVVGNSSMPKAQNAENEKQYVSLLSGLKHQDADVSPRQNQQSYNPNKPQIFSNQSKSAKESTSLIDEASSVNKSERISGEVSTSSDVLHVGNAEPTPNKLLKFCKIPNKGTPVKTECEDKVSEQNRPTTPNLFDNDSETNNQDNIEESKADPKKPDQSMSNISNCQVNENNKDILQKKPLFKKNLRKTSINKLSDTDNIHLNNDDTENKERMKDEEKISKKSKDFEKTEILSQNLDSNKILPDEKIGDDDRSVIDDTNEDDVEVEETLKTKRGNSRGVKRRRLSRNRTSAKRSKGVDFLDGIDSVNENKTKEKQTKLVCVICGKVLLPVVKGTRSEQDKLRQQVQKNYKFLIKSAHLDKYMDGLMEQCFFDTNDMEVVNHEPTTEGKNRKFLNLLFKKNPTALNVFIQELIDDNRNDIAEKIKETPIEIDQTDFEKRKRCPEFVKKVSKQRNPEVIYTSDIKLTGNNITAVQSSTLGTSLNCSWDPVTGCCIQYLQCANCSKTENTQISGVYVTCTTQINNSYQTGQAWFFSSAVKVQ